MAAAIDESVTPSSGAQQRRDPDPRRRTDL